MQILITGGSGFIGTHLTRLLLSRGHQLRIFDLIPPKHPPHPHLTWLSGDIREPEDLNSALAEPTQFVFHLAAIVSVPECENDPEGSARTNVGGTKNVIDAILASRHPGIPLVFASSAAVYGNACKDGSPLSEDLEPLEPVSHYGRQKLECERWIRNSVTGRGLRGLSLRFFNVFGEGQDPNSPYSGVITRFREAIRDKREALLYNEGKNTRDFISVTDIARACELTLHAPTNQLLGQLVNLCSGRSISVSNLYEEMCHQAGVGPQAKLMPAREGDIAHSCGDPTRARELLGFETNHQRNWWEGFGSKSD